jgi:hypothetical protein
MTEDQWCAGTDPITMIRHLHRRSWRTLGLRRYSPSERKLRLLLVAFGRRTVPEGSGWSPDDRSTARSLWEAVVNDAERMADGLSCEASSEYGGVGPAQIFLDPSARRAVRHVLEHRLPPDGQTREVAAALIRDIFGTPFRPVPFEPAWRTDTVLSLAQQMYDSRDFSGMPILADALQEAGCASDDILTHCRDSNATHTRGCWVVDLVLSKG